MAHVIVFTPDVERKLQIDRIRRAEFDLMEKIENIADALATAEAKLHALKMERLELEEMAAAEANARNGRR